jgi:hypothetical protein
MMGDGIDNGDAMLANRHVARLIHLANKKQIINSEMRILLSELKQRDGHIAHLSKMAGWLHQNITNKKWKGKSKKTKADGSTAWDI